MVNDPIQQRSLLLVILEKNNVDRMAMADPVTLEPAADSGVLPPPQFPQRFSVFIAYEPDSAELYRRLQGDKAEFMKWLERGYKFDESIDGVAQAMIHIAKMAGGRSH
jgi:hypothetical protein